MKKRLVSLALCGVLGLSCLPLVACNDNAGGGDSSKTYNIIMASATIPPMVSMLDTIDSENQTYLWVGRQNTIYSTTALKDVYGQDSMVESWSTASNIPATVVDEMSQKVANIWYQSNGKANFNIYVTDYGILAALYLVNSLDMEQSHYNIHMVEDGSGAYSQFYGQFAVDSYQTKNDEGLDVTRTTKQDFDENLASLKNEIAQMKAGKFNKAQDFNNYKYVYAASTLENVDYYLQYPEMIESKNADIQEMIENKTMKLVKKHQTELYNALSNESQAKFKNIILNPELDNVMTPEEGKQGVLMITGTSFTGEGNDLNKETFTNGEGCRFEQYVNYIVEKYGKNYTIVYKGHPSWGILDNEVNTSRWYDEARLGGLSLEQGKAAAQRRKEFFESKNIAVLPAQTPAEAFIWAYSDVLTLCGYDSSLYFNAPKGKVECIFVDSDIKEDENAYTTRLGTLNSMLFSKGGQLYNENMFFLDLNYILNNPIA